MTDYKILLQTTEIYKSKKLQSFLLSLESKYNVDKINGQYSNLVNFSTNTSAPYHQWFNYREGFSGQLVLELIKLSGAQKSEYIVDPFCGSGTTNVVATLNGYNTIGLDVNPMSAFIANAKITYYTDIDLKNASLLHKKALKHKTVKQFPEYLEIEKYFDSNNLQELLRIKTFIDTIPNSSAKTILLIAFISIIIDCSNRKRDGNGLRIQHSKIADVNLAFSNKVKLILEDIEKEQSSPGPKGYGLYGNAFDFYDTHIKPMDNVKVGTIIFSPPYANSFDYFESYKLELILGGFAKGMKEVNKLRQNAIRSFVGNRMKSSSNNKFVELLAKEIEKTLPEKEKRTGKVDTRTRKVPNMIRSYFYDMHEVIRQCSLSLDAGKRVYIVVDQSAYVGTIIPTDLLFAYFGEIENFKVERIIECRKARTSPQQLKQYPYLKAGLRESIIELIKK